MKNEEDIYNDCDGSGCGDRLHGGDNGSERQVKDWASEKYDIIIGK